MPMHLGPAAIVGITGKHEWRRMTPHTYAAVEEVRCGANNRYRARVCKGSEDISVGGGCRMKAEKSPEVLLRYQLPGGQGRALRGSVIAGIPQT